MSRWIGYLWRALVAMGESGHPMPGWNPGCAEPPGPAEVDLRDDASVRAAFRSIVEREWGTAA